MDGLVGHQNCPPLCVDDVPRLNVDHPPVRERFTV